MMSASAQKIKTRQSLYAKPLNIGLVGAGQVGTSLARELMRLSDAGYSVRLVSVASKHPKKFLQMDDVDFTQDYQDILRADNVDVVIETVGGVGTALDVVRSALESGKNVVTNNSALMAACGENLMRIAENSGAQLRCDSAVLAGIPTLQPLLGTFAHQPLKRMYGVWNATCNFVLMRMRQNGESLSEALRAARELGYADGDSSLDVTGIDTLMKACILSGFAYGNWPDIKKVKPVGIEKIQAIDTQLSLHLGYRIKLLGFVTPEGIHVAPHLVDETSLLGRVQGTLSGFVCEYEGGRPLFMAGETSSIPAAVQAISADVLALARGEKGFVPRGGVKQYKNSVEQRETPVNADIPLGRFYVRAPKSDLMAFERGAHIRVLNEYYDERSGYSGLIIETGIPKDELPSLCEGEEFLILSVFDE